MLQLVVIGPVAAVVDHPVDRARPAEQLAAHPGLDMRARPEWHGLVLPGVLLVLEHQARALRDAEHRTAVTAAGFDQQDRYRWIGGQPVGKYASGRTGAGDDVVVA